MSVARLSAASSRLSAAKAADPDPLESLAVRRGQRWVLYSDEVPCDVALTHWMDIWAPAMD